MLIFSILSLASDFPSLDVHGAEGEKVITDLRVFLEERIKQRGVLQRDLLSKQEHVRALLAEVEKENVLSKQESSTLQAQLDQERNKVSSFFFVD